MKDKLLKAQSNKWFLLTDRADKEVIVATIRGLVDAGYKFIFSDDMSQFMRLSCDLFDWAAQYPGACQIKERNINGRKCFDLYRGDRLIAIK